MTQIKDPQLSPYYIQIDEYNYSVFKTIISTESGKPYDMAIGHYSNMGNCLKSIVKDSMKQTQVETIKGYLNEYENTYNKFMKILNIK
jgi:uncharacterized protein YutD